MALVKLYNKLNEINKTNLKDIPISTNSTLSILDNTIEFKINGKPSNILINYTGAGIFESKMPINIKVKISKTSILIVNIFKQQIPEIMFNYSGDINITSCQVMNFDGSKIEATINNNQNEQLFNKSKTNMEDDSLILYEETKVKSKTPFKSGSIKPVINKSLINKFGKIEKYSKPEKETIAKTIIKSAPRVNRTLKREAVKSRTIKTKPTIKRKPKYKGGKK